MIKINGTKIRTEYITSFYIVDDLIIFEYHNGVYNMEVDKGSYTTTEILCKVMCDDNAIQSFEIEGKAIKYDNKEVTTIIHYLKR